MNHNNSSEFPLLFTYFEKYKLTKNPAIWYALVLIVLPEASTWYDMCYQFIYAHIENWQFFFNIQAYYSSIW